MNVSEISDERLNNLATCNAIVPAMLVEVAVLAKAEQEHRRAAKVEKVPCPCPKCGKQSDFGLDRWADPPTPFVCQACREAAKPKPASAFAIKGVPATAGECAAFIQGVDTVKTTPIAVAGSGAARLLDADVRDARRKHLDSLDWDKPQTAGEVQRPESHKSPEHIRKVLDSVLEWSIRVDERLEKLECFAKDKPIVREGK